MHPAIVQKRDGRVRTCKLTTAFLQMLMQLPFCLVPCRTGGRECRRLPLCSCVSSTQIWAACRLETMGHAHTHAHPPYMLTRVHVPYDRCHSQSTTKAPGRSLSFSNCSCLLCYLDLLLSRLHGGHAGHHQILQRGGAPQDCGEGGTVGRKDQAIQDIMCPGCLGRPSCFYASTRWLQDAVGGPGGSDHRRRQLQGVVHQLG